MLQMSLAFSKGSEAVTLTHSTLFFIILKAVVCGFLSLASLG